ncbi:hypothetical protein VSS37_06625 [Candidatus Thiothrix sp. Deng01]|uniref:Peptide chain release factor 2 n=1 Tax=Candidatus Thiothrix phosphatis TaxID=3112415 RepID=A0ABU6CVN2_9GAMM|nr:hypothetical protein [Candidatus Thiothrix sp. Deng01]MEB4590646.1 hypothetical protein [Candidatus Thiothrix sp. Deng01]
MYQEIEMLMEEIELMREEFFAADDMETRLEIANEISDLEDQLLKARMREIEGVTPWVGVLT